MGKKDLTIWEKIALLASIATAIGTLSLAGLTYSTLQIAIRQSTTPLSMVISSPLLGDYLNEEDISLPMIFSNKNNYRIRIDELWAVSSCFKYDDGIYFLFEEDSIPFDVDFVRTYEPSIPKEAFKENAGFPCFIDIYMTTDDGITQNDGIMVNNI